MTDQTMTRRQRQREATLDEIVATSRQLLSAGEELSLRAIASRMGLTAPALYRYVGSYQELVDVVAYEIDKAATDEFREAAATQPEDDPLARLICASVAFRRWGLREKAEFSLVFANPVADSHCHRREVITAWTSGLYMHSLLLEVWQRTHYAHPELDELPPAVAEALRDPMFPVDVEDIPADHRGLIWVFMQGWATLYGTVALEVFGHMDPRIITSGALFAEMLGGWVPRLGVEDPDGRYRDLLLAELAR
ncbi:TetR/AcrR family transcriptional regulator [Nocardioides euryhalodurans]|uniref:TetR/AcrR family transcriptional regulator n=1 Tax=Nocardioides euryhalodurans TaxID=2518370 RepID=A0A4P7GLK0_9ACTN|nr:WHG domain-containing protein [Nocardioides euryhalodurans]QBR92694.1 TetR/AcrR family transcriptional regulator [Nocardioides euryhalodurans]